jgi:hypothetical protein
MLHIITDLTDKFLSLLKDDPVRPEIPADSRVNEASKIFVLLDEHDVPCAVTCVRFMNLIPQSVEELWATTSTPTTAVFYTIWSYQAGAGRKLIQATQAYLREQQPYVTTYVTLSPKTEMARRFHLKNGADVLQENADTVNYIYS